MRGNSKVLIIMILLCLPLLVSCGHSTEKRPNATENPQEDNEPTFKIDSEDVSSITVYSYEVRGKSPLT